jgi:hypothetical protein
MSMVRIKIWARSDKALRAPLDTRREGFRSAVTGEDKEKGGNLVLEKGYARFAVERG